MQPCASRARVVHSDLSGADSSPSRLHQTAAGAMATCVHSASPSRSLPARAAETYIAHTAAVAGGQVQPGLSDAAHRRRVPPTRQRRQINAIRSRSMRRDFGDRPSATTVELESRGTASLPAAVSAVLASQDVIEISALSTFLPSASHAR